jgi:hypothetical protein
MKKLLFYLSLFFVISLVDFSCKDECKDVICNNGDSVEGECVCDFGWGGDQCDFQMSSLFAGDWAGDFECINTTDSMTMHIEDRKESLLLLKMHTVGLELDIQGFSFNFDNYVMEGVIDSSFSSFIIDTFQITQSISGFDIKVNVAGNGKLLENNNLDLKISLQGVGQASLLKIDCVGELDKN